jgi:hypothetical protein
LFFSVLFVLLTVFAGWQTEIGHRFADKTINTEFRGLLLGIVLTLGISASALPYFLRSNSFDKYVL